MKKWKTMLCILGICMAMVCGCSKNPNGYNNDTKISKDNDAGDETTQNPAEGELNPLLENTGGQETSKTLDGNDSSMQDEHYSLDSEESDFESRGNTQNAGNTKEQAVLKKYNFQSAEEAEHIAEEDLLWIAQNPYHTGDFIPELGEGGYELFGIPLMEQEIEGVLYKENIEPYIFQSEKSLEDVNVNEEISPQVLQDSIDRHCRKLIDGANTWDGDTGSITKNEEIIYCGETEQYVQYSIRYTEVRTYYSNNRKITVEIPRAHRRCFRKNILSVPRTDYMGPVYFGQLTKEKVLAEEDFDLQCSQEPCIFRQLTENEEEYIYTAYLIRIIGGDYGMCDEAVLYKYDAVYNKETHKINNVDTIIKGVSIPGTENYVDEF